MKKTYCIRIATYSSTLTPFQADTIFGHLCWVVAYQESDIGLQKFLEPFRDGEPPFVISDGFLAGHLPKPLSAEFGIDDPFERKEIKRIEFLAEEDFHRVRSGEKFKLLPADISIKIISVPHNTVSRLTNTTLDEGGVYSLEETFIPEIDIYLKVINDEWKNLVIELFKELSKAGYGRKKSIGKGKFSVGEIKGYNFDDVKDANGFVTLSSFCPNENDPTEGLYKTFIKCGKLGEEFTYCGNPFKKPLIMIKTGSVFTTNGQSKPFYGRMIESIAPAKPEVVHYGYAFAVPIKIPNLSLSAGR